jgi:hypothetical protein
MCDFGISALVVGIVGTIVSTTMGIVGSVQQGKATQAQYNYQAEVNKRNAEVAQQNADQKRQEGIEESRMQRIKTLQRIGAQQAAMAANGIDISSGTALDTVEDTAAMGELDALTTRYNAETQAQAYENQANNFSNQANLDVFAGANAYQASKINAIGVAGQGMAQMGSVASNWYSPNSIANTGKATGVTPQATGYKGTLPTF